MIKFKKLINKSENVKTSYSFTIQLKVCLLWDQSKNLSIKPATTPKNQKNERLRLKS